MPSARFILPSILVISAAASPFKKPVGGADGIYTFYSSVINGSAAITEYLGQANSTAPLIPGGSQSRDAGVHCEKNVYFGTDDMNRAINGLASFFGTGNSFYAKSVSHYYGYCDASSC